MTDRHMTAAVAFISAAIVCCWRSKPDAVFIALALTFSGCVLAT